MHFITLNSETDFDSWRKAARALVLNEVRPSDVTWSVRGNATATDPSLQAPHGSFSVSAKFVALAQAAILHRNPLRFAILYRLLWRLRGDHDWLGVAADADVSLVSAMAKAVHRDVQRMQASIRFREIGREQKSHYVAWFEPEHHIVEKASPFFARRFADMPWSILTSDLCAHWDGHAVAITPGLAETPSEDRLEEVWRHYCASIFHPARLKTELPRKSTPTA
jgi:probable DNA metabolism protein